MADYGLLSGLAQGVNAGLDAYNSAQDRQMRIKQYKDEQEVKKLLREQQERGQKMEMVSKGLLETPEGGFDFTPEKKAEQEAELGYKKAQTAGLLADAAKKRREAGQGPAGEEQFKLLPKDRQVTIEKLSGKKAEQTAIKNQIDELVGQLEDPNIPERQKVDVAREQIKLLNSTLGADAVGAEEVARIASNLDAAPHPLYGKFSIGPDLKAYTNQLKNLQKRTAGSLGLLQKQVDEAYGRKSDEGQQVSAGQQQNVKIINGKQYRKVQGGWEEI